MKLIAVLFILFSTQASAAIDRDLSTFFQGALGTSQIHVQSNENIGEVYLNYETQSGFEGHLWLYSVQVGALGYECLEAIDTSTNGQIEGVYNIDATAFNVILAPPHFNFQAVCNQTEEGQNYIDAYFSIMNQSTQYTFTVHEFSRNIPEDIAEPAPVIQPTPEPVRDIQPQEQEQEQITVTSEDGTVVSSGAFDLRSILLGLVAMFFAYMIKWD